MALLLDRRRRADRTLEWRVWSFVVGACLGLGGIALEMGWLVWLAIGVLGIGFLLRFVPDEEEEPVEVPEDRPD